MPQFITIHRAPGLKREEMASNAPAVFNAQIAKFQQIYVNLAEGFLVSIFEAETRDKAEEQLEVLGFPIDEMHEIQFAQSRGEMEQMIKQYGKR
jgi:hypothetical protein